MVCRSGIAAKRPRPSRVVARNKPLAVLAALLAFCGCEPATEVSTWPIALRQVGACPVGAPSEIELLALGDFPSRSFRLSAGSQDVSNDIPLDSREIFVSVTTDRGMAEGRSLRGGLAAGSSDGNLQGVWVLPRGPSCPLGDEFLRASEGAAVVALPQGGALIAGGKAMGTLSSSDAYLLVEGSETRADVEGGMLLRRADASATLAGDVVVVAGGTADRRAGAHDTYELFEIERGRFAAARSGKLKAPRMQHAALLLADGRVLLAGGRAEGQGDPVDSTEILDPLRGTSEAGASLQVARANPSLLMLDSGRVLILAGRDARAQVIGSVELYSVAERRSALALSDLPAREEVVVAALPGARVAWLACDHVDAGSGASCELSLISEQEGELKATNVAVDFGGLVANGLKEMRLLYAGDGQLLWTGADDSDPTGRRRAFVIDPALPSLSRVDASRVPSQLLRLQNDLIAELDQAGVSLRAAFTRGRYASPDVDLLTDAKESLVFDGPGRWLWQEAGVQALASGARVDLGELRFAAFQGSLSVQGDFSVIFYDGLGQNAGATVRSGELQVDGAASCSSQLQDDAAIELRRSGETLAFGRTPCALRVPAGVLGIALVLEDGSILRGLRVTRL